MAWDKTRRTRTESENKRTTADLIGQRTSNILSALHAGVSVQCARAYDGQVADAATTYGWSTWMADKQVISGI